MWSFELVLTLADKVPARLAFSTVFFKPCSLPPITGPNVGLVCYNSILLGSLPIQCMKQINTQTPHRALISLFFVRNPWLYFCVTFNFPCEQVFL